MTKNRDEYLEELAAGLKQAFCSVCGSDAERAAFVRDLLVEAGHVAKHTPSLAVIRDAALPRVKDDPAFRECAAANQWETRRERGLPWRMDVFTFIRDTYGPWLGNGLMRSDLLAVDEPLCIALNQRLRKDAMPDWLNLPKGRTALPLSLISDPVAQTYIGTLRERWRDRTARRRANAAKLQHEANPK